MCAKEGEGRNECNHITSTRECLYWHCVGGPALCTAYKPPALFGDNAAGEKSGKGRLEAGEW